MPDETTRAEERLWCIVPNCDEQVAMEQRAELPTTTSGGGEKVPVMVPFCRTHGLTVGSSV